MKNNQYDSFKYFVECYFNWSMDYSDLEKLIDEFFQRENEKEISTFKTEVSMLFEMKDPEFIKELVFKFGKRNLSLEKIQSMISLMFHKMNDLSNETMPSQ